MTSLKGKSERNVSEERGENIIKKLTTRIRTDINKKRMARKRKINMEREKRIKNNTVKQENYELRAINETSVIGTWNTSGFNKKKR